MIVKSGGKFSNCPFSGRINILCTKCACHAFLTKNLTRREYSVSAPANPSKRYILEFEEL